MNYNASDIVGKTLYAKRKVAVKAQPFDDAPVKRVVAPGAPVGVVWSFVNPAAGRSSLYWMFESPSGYEYAEHDPKSYDLEQLESQFEAPDESGAWYEGIIPGTATGGDPLQFGKFGKQLTNAVILIAIVALGVTVIPRIWPKK